MRKHKKVIVRSLIFYFIAASVFALDQLLKCAIERALPLYKSVPVIKGFFYITHIGNKGAAFGIFPGRILPLIVIGAIVSVVIVYFHVKLHKQRTYLQVALALILGGSLGNLYDRIMRSYVVDFIDFRFWPAFNIADIAVNVGIVLVIMRLIFHEEELE